MGFPTKVQLIKRQASEQWYINFPSALAQALEFSRGEIVEWFVEDKSLLALRRASPPAFVLKKTLPVSSPSSSNSGVNAALASTSVAAPRTPKPPR
jgi:hypothetical protein